VSAWEPQGVGPSAIGADDPLAKAGAENFPVALRVLPERIRNDLQALYRFARHVDDTGDLGNGDKTARLRVLDGLAADVQALYNGERAPADPVVAALASPVARRRLPAGPFLRLIEANRQDQRVSRYATFDELVGYCRLSANPVGELVLHVFGRATPERIALSDRICTGLQLVEHWQDIAEDFRMDRVYLPQDDLHAFGVTEDELARPSASPALRALIAFETERAEAWLVAGTPLLASLTGRARLAVSGYIAGGRAACTALRRGDYDPLRRVPKPTSRHVAGAWLRSVARGWG
jgi:squalene synthase HpnC